MRGGVGLVLWKEAKIWHGCKVAGDQGCEGANLEPDFTLSGTVDSEFNVMDALSLEPQSVQVGPQRRLYADHALRIFVRVRNPVLDQAGDHHRIVRCRPHRLVRCA